MRQSKFGLAAVVLFLTIAGAFFTFKKVSTQMPDKIEYYIVYDGGDGKLNNLT